MCLLWRVSELGANVLPFGMTNDVSANALAAGASSLGGSVQIPGVGGKVSNFARELGALEVGDVGSAGQSLGQEGRLSLLDAGLAGAEAEGTKVPSLADAVSVTPAGDGASLVDVALGALDEAGASQLPAEAVEAQPGQEISSEDLPENEEGAADPLLALSTLPSVEAGFTALVPEGGVSGAASTIGAAGVGASNSGQAPVGSAGVSGAANGLSAGSVPAFGTGLPEPVRPVSSAAGQAGPAAPLQGGQAGVDTGQDVPVPVSTNTRRWQSELPEEFRAPTPGAGSKQVVQQQSIQSPVQPVSGVVPSEGDLMLASASLKEGGPEKGQAVELLRPAGETAKPSVGVSTPLVSNDDGAQLPQLLKQDGVEQKPTLATQASPASQAKDAGIPSGTADVAPQAAPPNKGLKSSDALVQPVTEASPQADKANAKVAGNAAPDVDAETSRERPVAANTSADAGPRPEARLANGALPAAAAAAVSAGVTTEKPDLSLVTADLSLSSEIGSATVRGGDLTGAMRTESLQTPNQAQSAQVASQVAAEIARNLKNGQTRFQMRFDPPELGRVEVNMKVGSDGSVQAHLIVERPETLDMFLRDQRGLERALEAAGLNPGSDNLQFSLKRDGEQQFASGNGQGDQPAGRNDANGAEAAELEPEVEDIVRMTLAQQRGGLDLKI